MNADANRQTDHRCRNATEAGVLKYAQMGYWDG